MVICSSMSEFGRPRSASNKLKMAPRPHSVSAGQPPRPAALLTGTDSTSSSRGFRLQANQDDSGSVYSLYKQKIDAMFLGPTPSLSERQVHKYQEKLNNCVQARIEKMFSDITKDVDQRLNEIISHSFTVDYLGSMPLTQKVTSLTGLQEPLRDLYFAYRRNLRPKNTLTGRLEISNAGLKVRYQGEKGDLEQLNTFPTIAVWSAVKFVLHLGDTIEYAFIPLITDPDNVNKHTLFRHLDVDEHRYITTDTHSPLFAVVMRKIGVAKQLECHGFVCQTSEDAIVIAATLYKSLMTFMHRKRKGNKPKTRNGISCISVASTTNECRSIADTSVAAIPVRPPRKKRSTCSSIASTDSQRIRPAIPKTKRAAPKAPEPPLPDLDAIVPYPESHGGYHEISTDAAQQELIRDFNRVQMRAAANTHQSLVNAEMKEMFAAAPFQRSHSIRKSDSDKGITTTTATGESPGDIFTKVTIPRSGSFLNARGLTRYKSTISRSNGQASGGSPLGFNELFNEFRLQEGLNSLDEILGAIIDSEGMSFNDLKPIYKEFLLKLALTLTKDELYQRSKSIMRRQKKKLLRRNSSNQNKRSKMIIGAKGLRKVFRRPFSVKFTQKFRNNSNKGTLQKSSFDFISKKNVLQSGSSISTSSYDTRQFQPKENTQVARKQSYRKRSESRIRNRDRQSTSEDSDFFTLQRERQKCNNKACQNQNRNSSSGYVSCSECSYDSDSCTCVSADKCYCPLGQRDHLTDSATLKTCQGACDSNDKCYCSLEIGDTSGKVTPLDPKTQMTENQYYRYGSQTQRSSIPSSKRTSSSSGVQTEISPYSSKPKPHQVSRTTQSNAESLSWCGCDTDSCSDSNKCYCQTDILAETRGTIFQRLKERGFRSRPEHIMATPLHVPNTKLCKKFSHTKSTKSSKSLEYLRNPEENASYYEHIQPKRNNSNVETKRNYSSDNLALDYELFTITDSKRNNHFQQQKEPIFRRSASDGGFRSVFKATDSVRSYNNGKATNNNHADAGCRGEMNGNHEALSVKKSAEIAALFADVKLSQTTDITHLMGSEVNANNDRSFLHSGSNLNSRISEHLESQRRSLLEQQKHNYQQIFGNGVTMKSGGSVASRHSRGSQDSNNSRKHNRSSLYSAQNGLYTIQSQSDDSRRSSSSEKRGNVKQYYNLNAEYVPLNKSVSCNLENSLGYLP